MLSLIFGASSYCCCGPVNQGCATFCSGGPDPNNWLKPQATPLINIHVATSTISSYKHKINNSFFRYWSCDFIRGYLLAEYKLRRRNF